MRLLYCVLAVVLGALPTTARAFSDPALYAESTLSGGGGGRFFTGAPGDSFTCAVCHTGAAEPAITIDGLPWGGFKPGKTYDISVSWTDPETSHALTMEILDAAGKPVSLSLPDPESIDADGRCDREKDADVAAFLIKDGKRQIVGVTDCHPSSLRFRFKAPEGEQIKVYVSAVRSDSSSSPDGDGVSSLALTVPPSDGGAGATVSSCQVAPARADGPPQWLWALLAGTFILVRRPRHRHSRRHELA